jgi:hypothetical protein
MFRAKSGWRTIRRLFQPEETASLRIHNLFSFFAEILESCSFEEERHKDCPPFWPVDRFYFSNKISCSSWRQFEASSIASRRIETITIREG